MEPVNWNLFLKQIADDYRVNGKPKEIFLVRFAYDNWRKADREVWVLAEAKSIEAYKKHMAEIYERFSNPYPDGCPELDPKSQGPGKFGTLRDWLREVKYPEWLRSSKISISKDTNWFDCETPVSPDSPFYVERPPVELSCYQRIVQPSGLIRIKAPRKMGKTSLLNKIIAYTDQQSYRWVRINLLQVETSKFADLNRFLHWFCTYVGNKIESAIQFDDSWDGNIGCTNFVEALLHQENSPLVLGLDGVDRIFQYPKISRDFFGLLRSWHEDANLSECWKKLRLVVVHCTEDYGELDINQSPFNVGLPIKLEEFTQEQVQELFQHHHIHWQIDRIQQLMTIIGGHPYLVQLSIAYFASHSEAELEKLLENAHLDSGIYYRHLHSLLVALETQTELVLAMKQVVASNEPVLLNTKQRFQLHSMGLVKWESGNRATPRCELYRQYFQENLESVF